MNSSVSSSSGSFRNDKKSASNVHHTSPNKQYDKYTYSHTRSASPKTAAMKPKKDTSPVSPAAAAAVVDIDALHRTPLTVTRHGFAVAEDGYLHMRIITPPRHMYNPRHEVCTAQQTEDNDGGGEQHQRRLPPSSATWRRFLTSVLEFSETELSQLSWAVLADVARHVGFTTPLELAHIEAQWKKLCLGGSLSPSSSPQHPVAAVATPAIVWPDIPVPSTAQKAHQNNNNNNNHVIVPKLNWSAAAAASSRTDSGAMKRAKEPHNQRATTAANRSNSSTTAVVGRKSSPAASMNGASTSKFTRSPTP